MGLKEEILALDDRKVVEVEVPEWGGRKVRVAAMSAAARDAWEIENYEAHKAGLRPANVRAALVGRCLVDDAGERIFAEADLARLGGKSAMALDRLYDVAREINGLTAAEVEKTAKN